MPRNTALKEMLYVCSSSHTRAPFCLDLLCTLTPRFCTLVHTYEHYDPESIAVHRYPSLSATFNIARRLS